MNKYSYKGQIITASTKKEAIKKIVTSITKLPDIDLEYGSDEWKKQVIKKIKELGFVIDKRTFYRNTLYSTSCIIAKSKISFKDSAYNKRCRFWLSITEPIENKFTYKLEILEDESSDDSIAHYKGKSKSLDDIYSVIKNKYKEFESITEHKNKAYELEQKFKH